MNLKEAQEQTAHIEDPVERADAISELLVVHAPVVKPDDPNPHDDPDFPTGALVKLRREDRGREDRGAAIGVVTGPGEVTGDVNVRWAETRTAMPQSIDGIIRVDAGLRMEIGELVALSGLPGVGRDSVMVGRIADVKAVSPYGGNGKTEISIRVVPEKTRKEQP